MTNLKRQIMYKTLRQRVVMLVGLVLIGLMLAACGGTDGAADGEETSNDLTATGFIESEEVSVVGEVGGRVDEVLADESDVVEAGEVLVRLDDSLLVAQRAEAEAAVAIAQANLDRMRAGATDEQLAAAEAAIEETEAQIAGAQRAAGAAWGAVSNPQSIDVQIASAQMELDFAQQQVELARVELDKAQIKLNWLREEDEDPQAIEFQAYTVEIIQANLRAAEARYLGIQQRIDLLNDQRQRPLPAIAVARSAQSQVGIFEAQLQIVQARYDLIENGAQPEEIAIAEAQVRLAEAQLAYVDALIAQLSLISPIDGVVTTRSTHPGETASPGVALLTIANLVDLKLVVYIPETQIGRVRLGAPVSVSVDAFPNRTFEGVVTLIANEAEFTPRNVQTQEERVNLVFAVEISIDNTDGRLKPGMPADVVIGE